VPSRLRGLRTRA